MTDLDRVRELIPVVHCKGHCVDYCGPVPHSVEEQQRMGAVLTIDSNLSCSALVNGRCTVYEERPLVCRMWGATSKMPCPWGCEIDGPEMTVLAEELVLGYYNGKEHLFPEQVIQLPGLYPIGRSPGRRAVQRRVEQAEQERSVRR